MFVLQRQVLLEDGRPVRPQWATWAVCGNASLLERICASLADDEHWRVVERPGTYEQVLQHSVCQISRMAG